jgi:hypothetical protein
MGDLKARCGLHSGPVTVGILRGQKAMPAFETLSWWRHAWNPPEFRKGPEIIEAGKSHWVSRRSEAVAAKAKGLMQTF